MKIEHLFPIGRKVQVCQEAPQGINWSERKQQDAGNVFTITGHHGNYVSLDTVHCEWFTQKELTLLPHQYQVGDRVVVTQKVPAAKDGFTDDMRAYLGQRHVIAGVLGEGALGRWFTLQGVGYHFNEQWLSPEIFPPSNFKTGQWVRFIAADEFTQNAFPRLAKQAEEMGDRGCGTVQSSQLFVSVRTPGGFVYSTSPGCLELLPPLPEAGWVQVIQGEKKDGIGWIFDDVVGRFFQIDRPSGDHYGVFLKGTPGTFHPAWLRVLSHMPVLFPVGTPVEICERPPEAAHWKPHMDLLCGRRSYVISVEPPFKMRLAIAPEIEFSSEWLKPIAGDFDATWSIDSILTEFRSQVTSRIGA